jgi:hypothetical protein
MSQKFNKSRDIDLGPELAAASADINENFDKLFLILRRSPLGPGGTLPVDGGGTGLGAVPAGNLLVGQGTTVLALLADVAVGNALISGGVGAAPTYGKINLTLHVTGVLPIANGGTAGATKTDGFDNLAPTTSKGDLIAHNGADNVRVPVGTDGLFLKADSAAATGVAWATGGGTHELLQQSIHTDADTQTRVLGDLISALGPTALAGAWADGLPSDLLVTSLATGGGAYWADGLPYDGLGGGSSGADVLWRRVPIGTAGQVLKSNGTNPEWGDAGSFGEVSAASQPKVRVYASSSVSIAAGAGTDDANGGTKVNFDTESFDTDAFHSTVTNTSRLTVPVGKAGYYLIVGQASWATSATGRKACWPYKNGTLRLAVDEVNGDDGGLGLSHTAVCFAQLAEGDYVELHVRQDSAGALFSLGSATGDLTSLSMYKLP